MDHLLHVLAVVLIAGIMSWGVKRIPALDGKFVQIFDVVLTVAVAIYAIREVMVLVS